VSPRRRGAFPLAFAVALAALIVAPHVLGTFQRVLLTEILIWALFALAFDLLYGYAGMLSFGQATFFGFGSYAVTLGVLRWGLGLWPALLLGAGVSALVAWVVGFFAVRIRGHYFVIITVVFSLIFFFWALNWNWLTGGDDGLSFTVPDLVLGPWQFSLYDPITNYYFVLAVGLAVFLFARRLVHSPLGKVFVGIRENEQRAQLIGYDVERFKLLVFVIAGAVSGLAGALYSVTFRYANARLMHWTVSGDAVVWTLVGGAGSLVGPVLGTGLLVVFTDYVSAWMEDYKIIIGAVIVLVAIVAPEGIVGLIRERWVAGRGRAGG
jgi:branched-chain amino acid transport system permease protein